MKIVFISSAFYPSIGGVQTHVMNLSRELIKRGHSVTVITEDKSADWQTEELSDNTPAETKSSVESSYFKHKKLYQIDIYYFKFGKPSRLKKFNIWYKLLKHKNLFKDADVIHFHDVFIWYLPLRFLNFRKKVFTTFHGYETHFPPKPEAIRIRQMSARFSYGVVCVGDFIRKWYGTIPDYVVYGGVKEVSSIQDSVSSIHKTGKLKILIIGRLEKDIGVSVYKDTLKKLKERKIKFNLTVCGDGTFRQDFEKYGNVLGFSTERNKYIKNADVVFASSYLSMLEVLSFKKPVFAAYTNPLKHDYLRMSPFHKYISISNDPHVFIKKLTNFRPNIALQLQAQRWASSQTWEKVADTYIDLWNKK